MGNNFCSQCGTAIGAGARFCPNCGQPAQGMSSPMAPPPPPQYGANAQAQYGGDPPGTSEATTAMWLGIGSLLCGIFLGIPAVIVGNNAKKKLEAAGQPTGTATAGIVMGVISMVWSFFAIVALMSNL